MRRTYKMHGPMDGWWRAADRGDMYATVRGHDGAKKNHQVFERAL